MIQKKLSRSSKCAPLFFKQGCTYTNFFFKKYLCAKLTFIKWGVWLHCVHNTHMGAFLLKLSYQKFEVDSKGSAGIAYFSFNMSLHESRVLTNHYIHKHVLSNGNIINDLVKETMS